MAAARKQDPEARWREVRAELLRHSREQADALEEIRLFARLSAEAAAVLRRPWRRRGGGRTMGDGGASVAQGVSLAGLVRASIDGTDAGSP